MAAFEIYRLGIFWNINLDHAFEIYNNKVLIIVNHGLFYFSVFFCKIIAL